MLTDKQIANMKVNQNSYVVIRESRLVALEEKLKNYEKCLARVNKVYGELRQTCREQNRMCEKLLEAFKNYGRIR